MVIIFYKELWLKGSKNESCSKWDKEFGGQQA